MDKSLLRAALIRQVEADLALQTRAALTSRDEAIHEESRPENQYDMHAQEAAYLAEGQARIVADLHATLAQYQALEVSAFDPSQPIAVGAVVSLRPGEGPTRHYFMGPRAGGLEVTVEGCEVMVVTPASPLGRQLLGHHVGDKVQIPGRQGSLTHQIVSVS